MNSFRIEPSQSTEKTEYLPNFLRKLHINSIQILSSFNNNIVNRFSLGSLLLEINYFFIIYCLWKCFLLLLLSFPHILHFCDDWDGERSQRRRCESMLIPHFTSTETRSLKRAITPMVCVCECLPIDCISVSWTSEILHIFAFIFPLPAPPHPLWSIN